MPIVAVSSIVHAQIPNPFKIPRHIELTYRAPEDVFNQPASSNGKPFNPHHDREERRVAASLLAKPQLSSTRRGDRRRAGRVPPRARDDTVVGVLDRVISRSLDNRLGCYVAYEA